MNIHLIIELLISRLRIMNTDHARVFLFKHPGITIKLFQSIMSKEANA